MGPERAITEPVRPEMLQNGRKLRGLTQRELAEAAGIDQALISKYENGRPIPDADLRAIGQVLQLPLSFFRRRMEIHAPNGANMVLFRRRQTTSVKFQEQVWIEMARVADSLSVLLESVEVETLARLPCIEPDRGDIDEIEEIADRLRLELKIPPGPIGSVTRVLESVGVVIVRRQLPPKVDALVDSNPGKLSLFLLSDRIQGGRARFTLSHELGHLVMHNPLAFGVKEMDLQADRFASAFLMPSRDIKSRLRHLTLDKLIALSVEWKVSVQSLVYRAGTLGAISQDEQQKWYIQFNRRGYHDREPIPIPLESPTLLRSLVKLHLEDLRYSVSELSEVLSFEEWEFRSQFMDDPQLRVVPPKQKPVLRPFASEL